MIMFLSPLIDPYHVSFALVSNYFDQGLERWDDEIPLVLLP